MESDLIIGIGTIIVGILATVIPMAFVLRQTFGSVAMQRAESQRLLQIGMPASARVMGVRMGGRTVITGKHRHLQLVIQLEVHPPGRPPYAAQLTALVSERQLPQVQPGATVKVRIHPANPARLALEAVSTPSMHYGPGPASPWGPASGFTPLEPVPVSTAVKVFLALGLVWALVSVGVLIAGAVGSMEL